VQIRIEGSDLPGSSCGPSPERPGGHPNIAVGVQRRNRPGELVGLVGGDAPFAAWTLDCAVVGTASGVDLKGRYISGPPGGRFIYLSWVVVEDDGTLTMFRRAKLWLDAIPAETIEAARSCGSLVGRLGLTDEKGNPRCASVRPPRIEWSAANSIADVNST
jgi:hypothetical protein